MDLKKGKTFPGWIFLPFRFFFHRKLEGLTIHINENAKDLEMIATYFAKILTTRL